MNHPDQVLDEYDAQCSGCDRAVGDCDCETTARLLARFDTQMAEALRRLPDGPSRYCLAAMHAAVTTLGNAIKREWGIE